MKWITVDFSGTSSSEGFVLGNVKWRGPWRKYAFYPTPDTVFEQDCLRDIATFCDEQTTAHRGRER